MKKLNTSTLLTMLAMLFFSLIIVITYYFIRTDDNTEKLKPEIDKTNAEILINKDLKNDYPFTPKAVLEFYIEISKSFYNENLEEIEIEQLADQVILMFDEELLTQNTPDNYKLNLKAEIDSFQKDSKSIKNYITEDNYKADFWTKDNREYASRIASYTINENNKETKVYYKFLFRKDEEGQWKILGWLVENQPAKVNKEE